MKSTNILRLILSGFIATLITIIMVCTLYATQITAMSKEEVTNSSFIAEIKQMWVPDGTLNNIYCRVKDRTMIRENIDLVMVIRVKNNSPQPIKIANYSLEAKPPLKGWKEIKRVKPVLPNKFYTEYIDSSNPAPEYLDFSQYDFDILAQTKIVEPGDSITGWSFFSLGYKPDLRSTEFRLKLYNAEGQAIQPIALREGDRREQDSMTWISLKAIENPFPLCHDYQKKLPMQLNRRP